MPFALVVTGLSLACHCLEKMRCALPKPSERGVAPRESIPCRASGAAGAGEGCRHLPRRRPRSGSQEKVEGVRRVVDEVHLLRHREQTEESAGDLNDGG